MAITMEKQTAIMMPMVKLKVITMVIEMEIMTPMAIPKEIKTD